MIARVVVGGCGPRGFHEYVAGALPIERIGLRSLIRAAEGGHEEALERLEAMYARTRSSVDGRGIMAEFHHEDILVVDAEDRALEWRADLLPEPLRARVCRPYSDWQLSHG